MMLRDAQSSVKRLEAQHHKNKNKHKMCRSCKESTPGGLGLFPVGVPHILGDRGLGMDSSDT